MPRGVQFQTNIRNIVNSIGTDKENKCSGLILYKLPIKIENYLILYNSNLLVNLISSIIQSLFSVKGTVQ